MKKLTWNWGERMKTMQLNRYLRLIFVRTCESRVCPMSRQFP